MLWSHLPGEMGTWTNVVLSGVFGAALAEEFLRYALQSRLQALTARPWLAIAATALVWCLLHVPVAMKGGGASWSLVVASLNILPLGLAWGYLTWRSGGWVPAFLLHATNLWGLQNVAMP